MHHARPVQRKSAPALDPNPAVQQSASFVDNRPEAIAQRKLQAGIQQSQHVQASAQLKAAANPKESAGGGQSSSGLPEQLKAGVESMSGMDMSDVKVHYNSDKPQQLQAHAYAQGSDIHLAAGQEKHLPHEAWHVVQQKQGRVQPTTQLKGKTPVNDDKGLEREADEMGAKALQMKSEEAAGQLQTKEAGKGAVQRMYNGEEEKKEEKIEIKEEEKGEEKPKLKKLGTALEFILGCEKHYSNQPGSCFDKAFDLRGALKDKGFEFNCTGYGYLIWTEEYEDGTTGNGNHICPFIELEEGTYILDTTIQQFGGSKRYFFGKIEDWKSEVLKLAGSSCKSISNESLQRLKRLPEDKLEVVQHGMDLKPCEKAPETNPMISVKTEEKEEKKDSPKPEPKGNKGNKKGCLVMRWQLKRKGTKGLAAFKFIGFKK